MASEQKPLTVREAVLLLLDQVDYTTGACAPTEMVAAVLSVEVITKVREALSAERTYYAWKG